MSPRFLVVNRTLAGRTVVELLRSHFHLTPADVRHLLKHNGILLAGRSCRDLTQRVRTGQKLRIEDPAPGRKKNQDSGDRSQPSGAGSQEPEVKSHAGNSRRDQAPQTDQPKIHVVYMDKDVLVVEKPAGLTTVRHASERAEFGDRAQRFLPTTLLEL